MGKLFSFLVTQNGKWFYDCSNLKESIKCFCACY